MAAEAAATERVGTLVGTTSHLTPPTTLPPAGCRSCAHHTPPAPEPEESLVTTRTLRATRPRTRS